MSNRETMQQALECIERLNMRGWILADFEDEVYASIDALKAALEQPEQEPVAYYHPRSGFYWAKPTHISAPTVVDVEPLPLYAAPPAPPAAQRPWQGLTDEEIESAISDGFARGLDDGNVSNQTVIKYVRGIEAALRSKNT